MKHLILTILLVASAFSQGGIDPTLIRTATLSKAPTASIASSVPSAGLALDTESSDQAQAPAASATETKGTISAFVYKNPGFDNANNAWNYLQKLGGGCCDNCNKICGMAIKIYGTKYYLTNENTYYRFQFSASGSPNSDQVFTLGQNADCTWSISNNGQYLSTSSIYSGQWVGPISSVSTNSRWYIERAGAFLYVQSASLQYNYWRASAAPWYFLGYSSWWGTRLTFEYFPCDKKYGWNW